jgi:hypothetical protein
MAALATGTRQHLEYFLGNGAAARDINAICTSAVASTINPLTRKAIFNSFSIPAAVDIETALTSGSATIGTAATVDIRGRLGTQKGDDLITQLELIA